MAAEQAEVVGQNVAIKRLTQLGAECAAANTAGKASEDCPRNRAETDTDRSGDSANQRTSLPASQCRTDATSNAANGTDSRADFHGVMERSDFGGMTARALQ